MRRLCSNSPRSYLGRSASRAPPLSQQRSGSTASGNTGRVKQKSAAGIVARCQARLLRHSKAERRSEQIGRAATMQREGLNWKGQRLNRDECPATLNPHGGVGRGCDARARTGAMNGAILFTLPEPPDADPHVRWCGEGEGKPPPYPIRHYSHDSVRTSMIVFLVVSTTTPAERAPSMRG
jgi:hypothetical protein